METPRLLPRAKITKYNELRGYTDPAPCTSIPDGHDPEMWRRHNGCP
jgi:hypothetical protein